MGLCVSKPATASAAAQHAQVDILSANVLRARALDGYVTTFDAAAALCGLLWQSDHRNDLPAGEKGSRFLQGLVARNDNLREAMSRLVDPHMCASPQLGCQSTPLVVFARNATDGASNPPLHVLLLTRIQWVDKPDSQPVLAILVEHANACLLSPSSMDLLNPLSHVSPTSMAASKPILSREESCGRSPPRLPSSDWQTRIKASKKEAAAKAQAAHLQCLLAAVDSNPTLLTICSLDGTQVVHQNRASVAYAGSWANKAASGAEARQYLQQLLSLQPPELHTGLLASMTSEPQPWTCVLQVPVTLAAQKSDQPFQQAGEQLLTIPRAGAASDRGCLVGRRPAQTCFTKAIDVCSAPSLGGVGRPIPPVTARPQIQLHKNTSASSLALWWCGSNASAPTQLLRRPTLDNVFDELTHAGGSTSPNNGRVPPRSTSTHQRLLSLLQVAHSSDNACGSQHWSPTNSESWLALPRALQEQLSLEIGNPVTASAQAQNIEHGTLVGSAREEEFTDVCAQGNDKYRWHEITVTSFVDPATEKKVLLVAQNDVTVRSEMERRLMHMTEAQLYLLENMFPRHILERIAGAYAGARGILPGQVDGASTMKAMTAELSSITARHNCVTVMFTDIVGFTSMSKEVEPEQVMLFLNELFSKFDDLAIKHAVSKVETAGDCYIVCAGLLEEDAEGFNTLAAEGQVVCHARAARRVLNFAAEMLEVAQSVMMPHNGLPVQQRVGLHSGPLVSGLIGQLLPKFTLVGDTMNTASRMESTSLPGRIQVSEATYTLLKDAADCWECTGGVTVKGKGVMNTWLLVHSTTRRVQRPKSCSNLGVPTRSSGLARFQHTAPHLTMTADDAHDLGSVIMTSAGSYAVPSEGGLDALKKLLMSETHDGKGRDSPPSFQHAPEATRTMGYNAGCRSQAQWSALQQSPQPSSRPAASPGTQSKAISSQHSLASKVPECRNHDFVETMLSLEQQLLSVFTNGAAERISCSNYKGLWNTGRADVAMPPSHAMRQPRLSSCAAGDPKAPRRSSAAASTGGESRTWQECGFRSLGKHLDSSSNSEE